MKKRTCRHFCPTCLLNFEDRKRYEVHIASKYHQDGVAATNEEREEIRLCDDDDNIVLCPDECDLFDKPFEPTDSDNPDAINTQESRNINDLLTDYDNTDSQQTPQDNYEDDENLSTDEADEMDDEPLNAGNFFPFPSKIFFLLYCYVHNICRPQVSISILNHIYKASYLRRQYISKAPI